MNIWKKLKAWTPLNWLIVIVLIACCIMIGFYSYYFWGKPSTNPNDWSVFGDYFAAVFGLLAFLGVLYTARLSEKRAEKAERESIKREERDQFFKMLELVREQSQQLSKKSEKELGKFISNIQNYIVRRLIFHFIKNINDHEWNIFKKDYHSSEESKNFGSTHFLDKVTDIFIILYRMFDNVKNEGKSPVDMVNISIIKLNLKNSNYNKAFKHSTICVDKDNVRHNDLEALFNYLENKLSVEIVTRAIKDTSQYYYSSQKEHITLCKNITLIVETINKYLPETREMFYEIISSQLKSNELILLLLYLFSENYDKNKINLYISKNLFTNLCYRDFIIIDNQKFKNSEDLQLSTILMEYYRSSQ